MTSLERISAILRREPADRVPVYPIISGVSRHLTGADYPTWATDVDTCAHALITAADQLELDLICTLTDLSVEAGDFGQALLFPSHEAAHPDFQNRLIPSPDQYHLVKPINPRITPRMSTHIQLCRRLVEQRGDQMPIVAFVFAPLGILSMLRGQQDLYMDLYDEPDQVKHALAIITEVLIDYCNAIVDTGVHAIMLDTLFASRSIMRKSMWLAFEGGCVKKIADAIHARGCMVMVHNCGNGSYFDAQIETMRPQAISFLHIPDDCLDMAQVKQKYGHQTTLIGCIPPTWLPEASTQQVEQACRELMDAFKPGGGFILSTGCEYPANLSLDHAKTIVHMAKTYGVY